VEEAEGGEEDQVDPCKDGLSFVWVAAEKVEKVKG
jgi:hypothetical protein